MASPKTLAFLAIFFFLHLKIAKADFLSPLLSPAFDNVCKEVECGKGKCQPSLNGTFPYYTCECDPGWKQTRADNDDHLKFLPCIVPNFCRWTDCGGGSCNKTSLFTHDCKCSEGYYNLLNISAFPCYRECAIGMDCQDLGISMSNKSTSTTPVSSQNDLNQAASKILGNCHWVIMLVLLLAMVA